jgi:uncharacterized protein YcbK (DUF882 family)
VLAVSAARILASFLSLSLPAAGKTGSLSIRPSSVETRPGRPAPLVRRRALAGPRAVDLFQVNTRETFRLRFADDRGRPIRGEQGRADRFFRCHHTNARGRMNPRLLHLLFETGRHWPGRRVEVVSGFRHRRVARNPHSPHIKGLACDFRIAGVANVELRDYLRRAFPSVGVGYYPNSSFVHLDVRRGGSAFWIDYSGPGESPVYSDNPTEDLRSGRADAFRPGRIDPAWAGTGDESLPENASGADGQGSERAAREGPAFHSVR